MHVSLKKINT